MRRRIILIVIIVAALGAIGTGTWLYTRSNSAGRLLAKAQLSVQASQFEQAAQQADEYITRFPDDWRGYYWKANAFLRSGKYEESRQLLEPLLESKSASCDQTAVRMLLSETYSHPARRSLGAAAVAQRPEALESIATGLQQADDVLAKIDLTQAAARSLDVTQARAMNCVDIGAATGMLEKQYTKIADIAEQSGEQARQLEYQAKAKAAASRSQESLRLATETLLTVVTQAPSRAVASRTLVQLCITRKDTASLDKARQALSAAADPPPEAMMMLIMYDARQASTLADAPLRRGKLTEATAKVDQLIANHGDELSLKLGRAELALWLDDGPTVRRLCDEVLAADPRNGQARFLCARLFLSMGRIADAERELFTVKTDYPYWEEAQYAYALATLASGKKELARQAMRSVVKINPAHAGAMKYLIESLLQDGCPDQAFEDAKKFYRACPQEPQALRLYVDLANRTDQTSLARETLVKACEVNKARPEMLMTVAEGYAILGDKTESMKIIQGVAGMEKAPPETRESVVRALIMTGRTAEAERMLTDQADSTTMGPQTRYELGKLYFQTGRTLQAIEQFRKALSQDDKNAAYKLSLARALFEDGQLAACQDVLKNMDPADTGVGFLLLQIKLARNEPIGADESPTGTKANELPPLPAAVAFLRSGQPKRCAEICQAALKKNPDNADLLLLLGQANLNMDNRDECLNQWKAMLTAAPGQMSAYLRLASLLSRTADVDIVLAQLQAVPKSQPDLVELACGWLYENQGHFDRAAAVYEKLATCMSAPSFSRNRAMMLWARSLSKIGQVDKALTQLDSLAQDPVWGKEAQFGKISLMLLAGRNPDAQAILDALSKQAIKDNDTPSLYRIVELYKRIGQSPAALAACDALVAIVPNDPNTYSAKAAVLSEMGRGEQAVAEYRKAIEKQPSSIGSYLALAMTLDSQQKPAEALEVLDQLAKVNDAARCEALFERGTMLAGWGLQDQAVQAFDEISRLGYTKSLRVAMAQGRALALLGRKPQARAILESIPAYADEYVEARHTLAGLADDVPSRLKILEDLDKAKPDLEEVLQHRMEVLITAGRPADAVAAFDAYVRRQGKESRLPDDASFTAILALTQTGDLARAQEWSLRLKSQTNSDKWRRLAAVLHLEAKPQVALDSIGEISKLELKDAAIGLCAAVECGNAQATTQWRERFDKICQAWTASGQSAPALAGYKVLLGVSEGKLAQARTDLDLLKGRGVIDRSAASEIVSSAAGNPKAAQEARCVLRATLALDLGLAPLGARWAKAAFDARPSCQWAAAMAIYANGDPLNQKLILRRLTPPDCSLSGMIGGNLLMHEKQYAQAADVFAQWAGQAADNTDFLMQQASATEKAGKLDDALKLYRQAWQQTKDPALANNAAYLMCVLAGNDATQVAQAQAMIDEACKALPQAAALRETAGWVAFLGGRQDKALADLRLAIKGLIGSPEAHHHLAVVELACGNRDLARWHFEAAAHLAKQLQSTGGGTPLTDKIISMSQEALKKMGEGKS